MQNQFKRLRKEAKWLSVVTVAISVIALLLLAPFAPPPPGVSDDGFSFSPGLYQTLQALATAVLSVGLLSVLFEIFLRESHGEDISKYLDLKVSLIDTGLREVSRGENFDWRTFLSGAHLVRAALRDTAWLTRHGEQLIANAKLRPLAISVVLPDEDGAAVAFLARAKGQPVDTLQTRIINARDDVNNAWVEARSYLHRDSSIEVISTSSLLAFDLVQADDRIAVVLGGTAIDGVGASQMVISFSASSSDRYPYSWMVDQVNRLVEDGAATWVGRAE